MEFLINLLIKLLQMQVFSDIMINSFTSNGAKRKVTVSSLKSFRLSQEPFAMVLSDDLRRSI